MEVTVGYSKAIQVEDDGYGTAAGSNHIELDGAEASTPSSGTGKRPIGRTQLNKERRRVPLPQHLERLVSMHLRCMTYSSIDSLS